MTALVYFGLAALSIALAVIMANASDNPGRRTLLLQQRAAALMFSLTAVLLSVLGVLATPQPVEQPLYIVCESGSFEPIENNPHVEESRECNVGDVNGRKAIVYIID